MEKRFIWVWLFCFVLLGLSSVEAQYRNGSPYSGRQNSIIPTANDPKPEAKPLTAEEIVDKRMPNITELASLNDFEQAVVSSILNKYVQQAIELKILNLDANTTQEKLEEIEKSQDAELKTGLPEEKYEIVADLLKNGINKVKAKSKKKKKKKKKNKDS